MKSNSNARTTSITTTHRAVGTVSIVELPAAGLGVLEDNALYHIGDIFALVGDGFQQFVDGLELDELAHVGLFAEQLAHGGAHDPVGVRLQAVDFLARLERSLCRSGLSNMAQQLDHVAQAFAAL